MQSSTNTPACITYSACPKLKNPVFRLSRYAGATIIEIPKSAAERIAIANDNRIIAATYAVMKHFKTNYAGKVDMKLVGEVLKKL